MIEFHMRSMIYAMATLLITLWACWEEWCWWDGEYEWTVGSGVTTLRARCSGATHLAHTFLSDVGWLHDALLCGILILGLERHTRQYCFEIWMEHPVDSKRRYLYVSMYFICIYQSKHYHYLLSSLHDWVFFYSFWCYRWIYWISCSEADVHLQKLSMIRYPSIDHQH